MTYCYRDKTKELGKVRLRQAHLIYLSTFLLLLWFPPSTRSFNCQSYKWPIRSSSHFFHQSRIDLWCYIFSAILPQDRIEHVSCYFLKVKKLKINYKSRCGLRRTGVLNDEGIVHLIICWGLFIPLGGKWPWVHVSLTSKKKPNRHFITYKTQTLNSITGVYFPREIYLHRMLLICWHFFFFFF